MAQKTLMLLPKIITLATLLVCNICFAESAKSNSLQVLPSNNLNNSKNTAKPILKSLETNPPKKTMKVSTSGPFVVIEWHLLDLAWHRLRFIGEYVVVDGFAFGAYVEGEKNSVNSLDYFQGLAGISATQYLNSPVLKGYFIRGEMGLFGNNYSISNLENSKNKFIFGLQLGGDVGYRYNMHPNFTTSFALGIRRIIPDFFANKVTNTSENFTNSVPNWAAKVQLGAGFSY